MPTTPPLILQFLALLGDSLSGISALLTLGVAVWAVKKALPMELEKHRHVTRVQRRAAVAETTWLGAFHLILVLRSFTSPFRTNSAPKVEEGKKLTPGEDYWQGRHEERKAVVEASNELLKVWALTELHLDQDKAVHDALTRLWICRAELLTAERMHAINLDQPGSDPIAYDSTAYENIHGGKGTKAILECEQELKRVLGPIARHDLEHSVVPATPTTPAPPSALKAPRPDRR